ncbi:sodium-dependent glucose transporter 1A-like [Mercenaria mercenaria]|uniref:sodium-dependent glucose transporter 1A-like n=1 Tax=Mercenaria mercenaria TaxID=6596 RepID=UPI00234FAEF5|nr:sodium-dependent glucose transporter 1A-like [Mercenaria mercenaria]
MEKTCENGVTAENDECGKFIVEIDDGIKLKDGEINREVETRAYRHRFIHTACVCFSMFSLGWRNGLVGPTFPDLRLITNEDLSTASWLFTAISFGGLIGSVCGGFAYDRFNKIAVFICIVSGLGIVAAVAPWCSHFAAMFIVHALHGGFASALDTAATADVTAIWRQKAGPFMQAVHGIFSVGAIISPFVSEPYMAKKIIAESKRSISLWNTSISYLESSTPVSEFNSFETSSKPSNYSLGTLLSSRYSIAEEVTSNFSNFTFGVSNVSPESSAYNYGETYIYIPYSIATFVCFIAASFYVAIYFIYGNVYNLPVYIHSNTKKTIPQREYFLSKKMKIVFTILLALTLTFYVMSERSFIGFLMTFIITELGWSKARGSSASSAFWIAFATGRLSGIIIVKYVHLSIVIMTFFLIITSGAVLLWLAVIYGINLLIWISVAIVGYGMSVIFASIFLWLSENIRKLTGKMASVLFIFFSSGAMVFPILVGHLMDKVSQMWFIYTQLILFCAMCSLFIFVLVLFNILKKRHETSK